MTRGRLLLLVVGAALVLWPLLPSDRQGSDDRAAQAIEATGHQPWMAPVHEPSDSAEPWLFALQATLGAAMLGFVLLRRRS